MLFGMAFSFNYENSKDHINTFLKFCFHYFEKKRMNSVESNPGVCVSFIAFNTMRGWCAH